MQTAKASRKQSSLSGQESAQGCIPKLALQAMQEKKALSSRGRGRLRGFLERRRPWGFSPEAFDVQEAHRPGSTYRLPWTSRSERIELKPSATEAAPRPRRLTLTKPLLIRAKIQAGAQHERPASSPSPTASLSAPRARSAGRIAGRTTRGLPRGPLKQYGFEPCRSMQTWSQSLSINTADAGGGASRSAPQPRHVLGLDSERVQLRNHHQVCSRGSFRPCVIQGLRQQ